VDSSSSSEGNSASELSPADACSAPTPRDVTCLPVTSNHGEKPQRSRSRLMSQRGDGGSTARRLAYEQFAHVMYTNRANLQHTIAVQQRLFQQQLSLPAAATTSTVRGYNVKGTPLQEIPPPLPPRPGSKKVTQTFLIFIHQMLWWRNRQHAGLTIKTSWVASTPGQVVSTWMGDCLWTGKLRYTGWAKKVNYCTFSISSLNIDQFSQFFYQ